MFSAKKAKKVQKFSANQQKSSNQESKKPRESNREPKFFSRLLKMENCTIKKGTRIKKANSVEGDVIPNGFEGTVVAGICNYINNLSLYGIVFDFNPKYMVLIPENSLEIVS